MVPFIQELTEIKVLFTEMTIQAWGDNAIAAHNAH